MQAPDAGHVHRAGRQASDLTMQGSCQGFARRLSRVGSGRRARNRASDAGLTELIFERLHGADPKRPSGPTLFGARNNPIAERAEEHDNGVMPPPSPPEVEYESTVASLSGMCLIGVTCYPLSCGNEGTEVEDWDFGGWHLPTMGVELRAESGTRYSAVWGQSFDYYGPEIVQAPMSSQLGLTGEPGGPPEVGVTGHPCWTGLIGVPLVGADIVWSEGDYGLRMPVAVEFRAPSTTVWLVAGRPAQWPPDGRFHLGTDDVMVVFTRELASAVGLPRAE